MSYRIIIHPKALKEIQALARVEIDRAKQKIYDLAENPYPAGYKKLSGFKSDRTTIKQCYRIRVGDYRVIYTIEQEIITITIVQVKKRGDIY
ncbi:MAG: type II toxin-antitoxin system RelE family toxin [Emticicia sp.]